MKLDNSFKDHFDNYFNKLSSYFNSEILISIEKLAQAGVSAIIQPSGSIRDKEIIKFANRLGMILVFSKTRHFRH